MKNALLLIAGLAAGTLLIAGLLTPGKAKTDGQDGQGYEGGGGFFITAIHYTLSHANPGLLNSVRFSVGPTQPKTVKISLTPSKAVWYSCTAQGGGAWSCDTTTNTQAAVLPATLLTVETTGASACSSEDDDDDDGGYQNNQGNQGDGHDRDGNADDDGGGNCLGTISVSQAGTEGSVAITPQDWIAAGYDFTLSGAQTSVHVSIQGAHLTLPYTCTNGRSGTITVSLPDATYTFPANSTAWLPTADQASYLGFEGSIQAPNGCASGTLKMQNSQVGFSAQLSWDDPSVSGVNVRFHYRDPKARGFANINCAGKGGSGGSACSATWSGSYQPR